MTLIGSQAEPSAAPTPRKYDFSSLYVGPDPRELFAALAAFDYRIPAYGAELFRRIIADVGIEGPLLDLCCSFGQDAALLNHRLSLDELYSHYQGATDAGLDRAELVAADHAFYGSRRRQEAIEVVGLDTSAPAIAYGTEAGLFGVGVVADLEVDHPVGAEPDLSGMADIGAIGVTGAISYIGERTFARLLDAASGRPWVAGFALRWIDIDPVIAALTSRGYTVQVVGDHGVMQRRTAGEDDARALLEGLARLGLAATDEELSGVHIAVPFLATPEGTTAPSLHDLTHDIGDGHY